MKRPHIPSQGPSVYKVLAWDYDTSDIMREVMNADRYSLQYITPFIEYIRGRNTRETLRNAWDFLRSCILYKEDPGRWQIIKAPSQLWHYKVGDCKSYSIFVRAVCQSEKIPSGFRFVGFPDPPEDWDESKYGPFDPTVPTHVYTWARDERGELIIIDGVWGRFDSEKPYHTKYDYPMPLVYIAGTKNRASVGASRSRIGASLKNDDFATPLGFKAWKGDVQSDMGRLSPYFLYLLADPWGLPAVARAKYDKSAKAMQQVLDKTNLKPQSFLRFVADSIREQTGYSFDQAMPKSYFEYLGYKDSVLAEAKKAVDAGIFGIGRIGKTDLAATWDNVVNWAGETFKPEAYQMKQQLDKYVAHREYQGKVLEVALKQFGLLNYDRWAAAGRPLRYNAPARKPITQAGQDYRFINDQKYINYQAYKKAGGPLGYEYWDRLINQTGNITKDAQADAIVKQKGATIGFIDPATAGAIISTVAAGVTALRNSLKIDLAVDPADIPNPPQDYGQNYEPNSRFPWGLALLGVGAYLAFA